MKEVGMKWREYNDDGAIAKWYVTLLCVKTNKMIYDGGNVGGGNDDNIDVTL